MKRGGNENKIYTVRSLYTRKIQNIQHTTVVKKYLS